MWPKRSQKREPTRDAASLVTGVGDECEAFLAGRPIAQLQRELLVPLELELMDDSDAGHLDPGDMIRLALARLYELPELSA